MEIAPTNNLFREGLSVELLNYTLRDIVIPEASTYKVWGIIMQSYLIRAHQVNYVVKKNLEGTPSCHEYSYRGK
jgi:hypothetical protein